MRNKFNDIYGNPIHKAIHIEPKNRTIIPAILIQTYKSGIVLSYGESLVWLSIKNARDLGKACIRIAKHREELDKIVTKQKTKWAKKI